MIKLDMPIIVEGKYDKIKLSSIFDATIITTDGFGIFKNKEKVQLIKKLAEKNGIIILTDSDSAGGIIRSYLKNILSDEKIYHVLLPRTFGKERRKAKASGEGLLGVEGMENQVIIDAFARFIPSSNYPVKPNEPITTAFLMTMGLSGCENSEKRRHFLLRTLNLPYCISTSTLKRVLSEVSSMDEIKSIMQKYKD